MCGSALLNQGHCVVSTCSDAVAWNGVVAHEDRLGVIKLISSFFHLERDVDW